MTIFRFSHVTPALAFLLLLPSPAAAQARSADECSNIDPTSQRECVGRRIETKQRLMIQLLARARAAVARSYSAYGDWDNRTHPRFLDESQGAWASFVDSNCIVIAAYGGGSNSSISDRSMDCYEDELDRRVEFLRQLAEGIGMFGL